jgi:hypothetical protein
MAIAVLLVAALTGLGQLGLRCLRRGPARFFLGPALLLAALVPLACSVCLAAWQLRQTGTGLALGGGGSVAAVAAGAWEALLPLYAGLLCTCLLSLTACALLAIGMGALQQTPRPRGPGAVALAFACLSGIGAFALATAELWLARGLVREPQTAQRLATASTALLLLGLLMLVLVTVFAVASALLAPISRAGPAVILSALALPLATALGSALLLVVLHYTATGLARVALEGTLR